MGKRLTKPKIRKWHSDTLKDSNRMAVRIREIRAYARDAKGGRHSALIQVLRDMASASEEMQDTLQSLADLAAREGVDL